MTRTVHRLHFPPGVMLVIAAALAATAFPAVPARAGSDSDSPGVVVRFDDLNLDRTPGVVRLYQRLHAAAQEVCGPPTPANSRIVASDWRQCVAAAVDRAVRQIDRPAVTAYHLARLHPARARQTAALNDRR
jgi:UrcA family protein